MLSKSYIEILDKVTALFIIIRVFTCLINDQLYGIHDSFNIFLFSKKQNQLMIIIVFRDSRDVMLSVFETESLNDIMDNLIACT
ncbi:hypothetical protein D3C79_841610 [compost metagenome]